MPLIQLANPPRNLLPTPLPIATATVVSMMMEPQEWEEKAKSGDSSNEEVNMSMATIMTSMYLVDKDVSTIILLVPAEKQQRAQGRHEKRRVGTHTTSCLDIVGV